VTLLTLVEPGSSNKLGLMLIVMTVEAVGEFNPVESVLPLCDVTLRALYFRVFAFQRILRGSMRFQIELRRFPSIQIVTGGALARVGTFGKLAVMGILVAVGALREYERLFEISVGMTRTTGNSLMLADQRVLGFGVIEIPAYP
jgi:hypothetical protein